MNAAPANTERTAADAERTLLFLRLTPPWSFISEIRRFVQAFCTHTCKNSQLEQRFALAAHELIQNAVSYSLDSQAELFLKFRNPTEIMSLTVSNRAAESEIARFRGRIDEMKNYPDSLAYYLYRMRTSMNESGRAGLGLARIWHEAQFPLAVVFHGDRVAVEVSSSIRATIVQDIAHPSSAVSLSER
jgi:hypothetical protein